jgi:tripartite-type tricarboxylate transporter receptor subunit TctC
MNWCKSACSSAIVGVSLAFAVGLPVEASAQGSDAYAGKRLTIIIGLEAGGTVDTLARAFAVYLKKHIPGSPTVVVQNMPGAGGSTATNYLHERAAPDGMTILYGPWDPLAQALGDQTLRARYEDFDYLGGTGDIRVNYARTDMVPGGLKAPRDIMKAENLILGALNKTDISGLLPHLALDALGIKHKMIVGYRGGNDVFLAMQRGEVQFHNTSISTFRGRNAAFVKSGQGIGIAYLVPVDRNGAYERSPQITEMPAFPDLYREIHGKPPSGPAWDALNWLTNQTGEMTYVGFAPRGTPAAALAALRKGFADASNDPDFIAETVKRNGIAFTFVNVERGQATFRSLAEVTPQVLGTLKASIAAPN